MNESESIKRAVVCWVVLGTGHSVYSAPMPYGEAMFVYHNAGPSLGTSHPGVFVEGTPEFEDAAKRADALASHP